MLNHTELTFLSPKTLTEEVKQSKGMFDRTIERMNKQVCHQELNNFSYSVLCIRKSFNSASLNS